MAEGSTTRRLPGRLVDEPVPSGSTSRMPGRFADGPGPATLTDSPGSAPAVGSSGKVQYARGRGFKPLGMHLFPQVEDPLLPEQEFDRQGSAYQNRLDTIRAIYETELGRQAEDGGLNYWANTQSDLHGDDLVKAIRADAGLDNTLYDDPAYAVYMRRMRQQEARIQQNVEESHRRLGNKFALSDVDRNIRQERGLRKVDDNAEGRGMFRSGERIRSRGELVTDIGLERATDQERTSLAQSDLRRDAARSIADLSRGRDEQEVAARNRATQRNIQEAADAAR